MIHLISEKLILHFAVLTVIVRKIRFRMVGNAVHGSRITLPGSTNSFIFEERRAKVATIFTVVYIKIVSIDHWNQAINSRRHIRVWCLDGFHDLRKRL